MDITGFINSKDIRDYHREIGYQYNALEAAWLVYQCDGVTLDQKHEAWKWIVDNMPDYEIGNCRRFEPLYGSSVHKVITDYLCLQNRFIDEFRSGGDGKFYVYQPCCEGQDGCYSYSRSDYEGFFSSWDKCVAYILENEDPEYTNRVTIMTVKPDEGEMYYRKHGSIEIDLQGRILDVFMRPEGDYEEDLDLFFEDLWFEFPVPFKRGDIVCVRDIWGRETPVVLTDIIIPGGWDPEKYRKMRREQGGDTSDMNFWGYEINEHCTWRLNESDSKMCYEGIDNDTHFEYMNLEYYRKDLVGANRVLKPISAWLKGEFGDDICLLLSSYHHILLEEELSRTVPVFYTKEGLRKAGFPVEEE